MSRFPISLRRRKIPNLIRGIDSPLGISLVSCVFVRPLMPGVTPHKVERPASEEEVCENTRIIVTHYGGPDPLRMVEEQCAI